MTALIAPNIVLVMTDDQEVDSVTADFMPTLHAQPGGNWVIFPNSVHATPLCGPVRASMYSGRRWDHTGAHSNNADKFDEVNSLGPWMKAAGYRTGMLGKYQNSTVAGDAVPPGWDTWFSHLGGSQSTFFYDWSARTETGATVTGGSSDADYFTDVLADRAVAFIEAVSGAEPWFLVVTPTAPHDPSTPPSRYASTEVTLDDPPDWNVTSSGHAQWLQDVTAMDASRQTLVRNLRANNRRTLMAVDDLMSDIFDALTSTSQTANTVVVFCTDNTLANGRKKLGTQIAAASRNRKSTPYRYSNSAELRIRYPGATARTETSPVSTIDLPATFLAMGGATATARIDGRDITGVILGTEVGRTAVESGYTNATTDTNTLMPGWWSLRVVTESADHNYIEWATGEVELYDRDADPDEMTNIAAANPAIVAQYSADLAALKQNPTGETRPVTTGVFGIPGVL